jgi:hypothetical protein
MIERGQDRRSGASLWFSSPPNDRRRPSYERRGSGVPAQPGAIRPGVGEAAPFKERRRVPESGME